MTDRLYKLIAIMEIINMNYTEMDVIISGRYFHINVIENDEFNESTLELIRDLTFVYSADLQDDGFIVDLREV